MNFKIKYLLYIIFLSYVKHSFANNICRIYRFLLNDGSYFDNSFCLPNEKEEVPSHHYLDTNTGEIKKCEEHCDKCTALKSINLTQCFICDEGFYLYKFRCIDECPNDAYLYTQEIKVNEEIKNVKICNEICEEGFTAFIFQQNNESEITKSCILNIDKNIRDKIKEQLNEFINYDDKQKLDKINEQFTTIKGISQIQSKEDFENIDTQFILINEYINNYRNFLEQNNNNIIETLNKSCEHYFELIENYFTSIQGPLKILNINENDNFIYFISSLSSLFKNNELLDPIYLNKLNNYTSVFSPELINLHLTLLQSDKINLIANYYTKYINGTIDKEINYIDDSFDQEKFESNEFYRYTHEILLNEGNIKLMEMTNDFIKFLMNIDADLFLYKNDFIYFYKQKLNNEKEDKQIIMSKLGLEIYLLGSESKNEINSFTINSILDSIDNGEIDNYKIIVPPLTSIDNKVNWDEAFFNLVIFNEKYPILNRNNTKYVSPNFFEINFYDKDKNVIKIDNLNSNNLIKIIKKKSQAEGLLNTCVFYDSSQKNLNDKGIKSYDLFQYILCATSHLSTFTLSSFSPSYLLSKAENNQEISEEEIIKNSRWIQDTNMLNKLTSDNAVILYINLGIIFLCIILFLVKFLLATDLTKAEQIIEDNYIRYTMNEDIESDKKILKYIIEKEIEFILKNRSDYEKQKRQELALNSKNDIFNSDQQVITIIEDGSDDDDEEDLYMDKKYKKVSFRDITSQKRNKKNSLSSNLKRNKTLIRTQTKKKDINIEISNVKDENNNDLIELDENREEDKDSSQSKKYKYFNFKNNTRKTYITSSAVSSNRRSTYANFENILNEKKAQSQKKVKRQSMYERFQKSVKEQKSRHIYSIMDKTITEFKSNGQNTLDIPNSMIKRPLSMIGISNALNKVNNKDDEKILIKNEFFVIMKLILFVLYQYEYRFISLFNNIILPITRNNLIVLMGFRLSIQLTFSSVFTPRYFGDNYKFNENFLAMFLTLIVCDIIYTVIEIILMKKKISTSTENKDKTIIKFKQIIESIIGYILMIFLFFFGLYHSTLISLYLDEKKIKCNYIANFIVVFFIDYLVYENIIIIIKGFILTYVVYQDVEGCGLRIMDFFNKIFIFYLAE